MPLWRCYICINMHLENICNIGTMKFRYSQGKFKRRFTIVLSSADESTFISHRRYLREHLKVPALFCPKNRGAKKGTQVVRYKCKSRTYKNPCKPQRQKNKGVQTCWFTSLFAFFSGERGSVFAGASCKSVS